MIDVALKNRLIVKVPYENAWPSIKVTMDQLQSLKTLLDEHGIRYWVSEHAYSLNGGPYETELHFYRDVKPENIQTLLDSAK